MLSLAKAAITNPRKIPGGVLRIAHEKLLKFPCEKLLYMRHSTPSNQLNEDWDNLIILDACRYDTFTEISDLDGELEYRISPASATIEWMRKAIGEQNFYDTVYVSANPRISRYEQQFHAVDHVWDYGWDEELKVAPPEPVVDAMEVAHENYQNKRLVAHFMQPHTPYIGEFAREHIGINTGDEGGRRRALGEDVDDESWFHAIDRFENGEISKKTVLKGYRENLRIVLKEVRDLLSHLSGKTVITADHGDMFGGRGWPYPRKLYDHPPEIPALSLRKVPWLVIKDSGRRKIVSEPPQTENEFEDEHVSKRLQQLGYLDA